MGKVKPDSQKITGGRARLAHSSNCSTRKAKSRVHAASGFCEGYAWRRQQYVFIHSLTHAFKSLISPRSRYEKNV